MEVAGLLWAFSRNAGKGRQGGEPGGGSQRTSKGKVKREVDSTRAGRPPAAPASKAAIDATETEESGE